MFICGYIVGFCEVHLMKKYDDIVIHITNYVVAENKIKFATWILRFTLREENSYQYSFADNNNILLEVVHVQL